MNRYLYADGDPVNNIDPDGHLPKWLQRGWKATKRLAKKGYNVAIGDDIRTLKSPKSKWYHKAGAAASIASNFIPGAGAVKWGIKAVKYGKKMKKSKKFVAESIKKTRKNKLKSKQHSQTSGYNQSSHRKSTSSNSSTKGTPKLSKPVSGDNIGVNLRSKGTGNSVLKGTNKKGEVTSRGGFRKKTVLDAWNNAEPGPNGGKLCPTCKNEVHVPPFSGMKRDWDIDHTPAWTNRTFPSNVTRKEVLDDYQKGTRLECPSCNRSRGNR